MEKFNKDYEFGKLSEDALYSKLSEYWEDNIKKSKDKFSKYDYAGDRYYYELKTRTNFYETYPTTLIAKDKVIIDCEKKQRFLFKFYDGLYYITYGKNKFKKYRCDIFGRTDRGFDKPKLYYYIPIEDLKKIEI
jgi:hypothetical protein